MTTETRKTLQPVLENEIEIAAPVEAVWKAISDGDELARWWPLRAKVTPGAGGVIAFSWSPEGWDGEATIDIWEPGSRLKSSWDAGAVSVASEFIIEARTGSTVLKVVSSGFGDQASWDHLYECMRVGWEFELRGLRHYLENHAGEDRQVAWAQGSAPAGMGGEEIWRRLMGSEGFGFAQAPETLAAGERYSCRSALGDAFEGVAQRVEKPHSFVGTREGQDGGLLRIETGPWSGPDKGWVIWLWLSMYGTTQERAGEIAAKWQRRLEELFPA